MAIRLHQSTRAINEHNVQCDNVHNPMLLDGLFTRQVVHYAPVDHLRSLGIRQKELYFFSTIIGGAGQRIRHRWLVNNQPVQEKTFTLGFDEIPIWSRQLLSKKQGNWEVQVWANNCLLDRFTITYTKDDEAQTIGTIKNQLWQRPKNVVDQIIIDSGMALIAKQDFTTEQWLFDSGMGWAKFDPGWKWMRERQASGPDGDDISRYILTGNTSIFKGEAGIINFDRRNKTGDTPLIEAVKAGREAVALSLLDNGANPFIRGADGSRPYTLAVNSKMKELAVAMINYAETESLWLQGDNERFYADDIRRFIRGHRWQQRNVLGDTPLLLAARKDNDWAVAALLQNDNQINVFMNDFLGKRAHDLAHEKSNLFAADLIEKNQRQSWAPWQILESSISTGLKGDRPLDCIEKQPLARSVTYYYFNHLMDIHAETLHHKWFNQNKLIKDIEPSKGSHKNILFSSQNLTEQDKGYWHVELVNEQGDILNRMDLSYGEKYSPGSGLTTKCIGTRQSLSDLIVGWQDPKVIAKKINGLDNFDRYAPSLLSQSIQAGNMSAVRMLLNRSIQASPLLNASNYNKPPLLVAVESGNRAMVKYLLYRGADVNMQNQGNFPALHQAVIDQNNAIVKLLLEAGATPTLLSKRYGSLPLISAANVCDIESMKLLVEHGARFDQKTNKGVSALEIANRDCSASDNWEQIRLLTDWKEGIYKVGSEH